MKHRLSLFALGMFVIGVTQALAEDAITTQAVNFRTGPGTRYAVLGSIPARQPIGVRTCNNNWCLIDYGARSGWASINYIAFKTTAQAYNSYNGSQPQISLFIYGENRWDDGYWDEPYWGYPHFHRPFWHHHYHRSIIPAVPAYRRPSVIPSIPAYRPSVIPATPALRRN